MDMPTRYRQYRLDAGGPTLGWRGHGAGGRDGHEHDLEFDNHPVMGRCVLVVLGCACLFGVAFFLGMATSTALDGSFGSTYYMTAGAGPLGESGSTSGVEAVVPEAMAAWSNGTWNCPTGYELRQTVHPLTQVPSQECVIRYHTPSSVDTSIIDDEAPACDNFMLHACGRWFRDAKPGQDRSFTPMTRSVMDRLQRMLWIETNKEWNPDPVSAFMQSCTMSPKEGGSPTQDELKEWLAWIGDGGTDLAAVWHKHLAHDLVSPIYLDMVLDPRDTRPERSMLFIERGGLFADGVSQISSSTHRDFLRVLFAEGLGLGPSEAASRAEMVVRLELALHGAIEPLQGYSYESYVLYGGLDHDTVRWEELAGPSSASPLPWSEVVPFVVRPDQRVWLNTRGFFDKIGGLFRDPGWEPLWRAYFQASLLLGSFWARPAQFPSAPVKVRSEPAPTDLPMGLRSGGDYWPGSFRQPFRPAASGSSPAARVLEWDPHAVAGPDYRFCQKLVWVYLNEYLEEWYVQLAASDRDIDRVRKLTENILGQLKERAEGIAWADAGMKRRIRDKLDGVKIRVARPNTRDFSMSGISVEAMQKEGSFWGVVMYLQRGRMAELQARLDLGVDRDGAFLFPTSEVNAYYHPIENTISILAGMLQPPFYHPDYDEASVHAGIGVVIGHELAHALDMQGIRYGPRGLDGVDGSVFQAYDRQCDCLRQSYTGPTMYQNRHDGEKTLNENIADYYGKLASKRAYQTAAGDGGADLRAFYYAFAQTWCGKSSRLLDAEQIRVDEHATVEYRVNQGVQLDDDFTALFHCNARIPCEVWG